MKKHTFTAAIQNSGGGGAFVEVPFDVEEAFGSKRTKVNATNEGVPHRGTLVRMGGPNHILIILKDIREKIGKTFGDKVKIMIEADVQPRVVAIPKNLAGALKKDREAKIRFGKLSQNHKRNRGGDCRLSQRTHLPRPQVLGRDDAGDRGSRIPPLYLFNVSKNALSVVLTRRSTLLMLQVRPAFMAINRLSAI